MGADDEIDRLWREHAPAVHRYARRRFPADTLDEIVAETFCVAWRRQDDVPADPLPVAAGGVAAGRGERAAG